MSMLLTTTGVAYIQYIIPLKGEQKAESKPWKSRESTKLHKQFFAWMSWLGKTFFCDSSFSFGSGSIMTKNGSYHYNWQNLCVVIELPSKREEIDTFTSFDSLGGYWIVQSSLNSNW